ncbi:MAG: RibD family protein [Chloroflexota bacterium]
MLPHVILHNAISLDGRMDNTVDMGLYYGIAGSFGADAMLSGSNTLITGFAAQGLDITQAAPAGAAPEEEAVGFEGQTLRWLVVVDSRGRIRNWEGLIHQPYWSGVMVLYSQSTPAEALAQAQRSGVELIQVGAEHVDLRAALQTLKARYAVERVRIDSGGILNGVLLRAGLVDEVSILVSPCLAGGISPRSIFQAPDLPASLEGLVPLRLAHLERLEGDVLWLRYDVAR